MTNQAGRLRDAAVFLFVAVYFLWFTADGLRAYLSYDDLMNLYCAWILPVKTVIAGNFLVPTVCERPLGTAFYRGIYALFGFWAFPFRAVAFTLLLVNIWLTYQTARRLTNSAEAGAVTALLAAVHSRFALIGFAAFVGVHQHVPAIHFVVQEVEPIARSCLRFSMQCRL